MKRRKNVRLLIIMHGLMSSSACAWQCVYKRVYYNTSGRWVGRDCNNDLHRYPCHAIITYAEGGYSF